MVSLHPTGKFPSSLPSQAQKLLMDFHHGQIVHLQKVLLQMGKSLQNHARDSLGQILLLGMRKP